MNAPAVARQQLLLVDDEEDALLELAELLEGEGFDCLTATSVKLALHHLTRHPDIALVITDLRMPEESGMSLIKRLREHTSRQHLPVIVTSGHADMEDGRCSNCFASRFFTCGCWRRCVICFRSLWLRLSLDDRYREQALSHRDVCCCANPVWERACSRKPFQTRKIFCCLASSHRPPMPDHVLKISNTYQPKIPTGPRRARQ